jgi:streptogramin lyase
MLANLGCEANTIPRLITLFSGALLAQLAFAQTATLDEFPIPTPNSFPASIISGADGNLWFDESFTQKIAKITLSGNITEYPTTSSPVSVIAGPDGNVWFTEIVYPAPAIGRITPAGVLTEFPLSNPFSDPLVLTQGPDGNLWFTEYDTFRIGKITPAGAIKEFPLPGDSQRAANLLAGTASLWFTTLDNKIGKITEAGAVSEFSPPANLSSTVTTADGSLWFGEASSSCDGTVCTSVNGKMGKINAAGVITEFPIPSGETPSQITRGPDGNLWFTEYDSSCTQSGGELPMCTSTNGKLANITPAGAVTEYPAFTGDRLPLQFFTGPDGNLWFSESGSHIGEISSTGAIHESLIPVAGSRMHGVTTGPDGNLWFIDSSANKIGKLTLSTTPTLGGNMSGSWYDPTQSGQGFQLEFTDQANTAVAVWYTFAPDGSGQRWIYAQGSYDSTKDTVTLPAIEPTGAMFAPNFNSNDITNVPWGTLTFTFTDCNHGTASWNSTLPGYGSGVMSLTRLTRIKGTTCP